MKEGRREGGEGSGKEKRGGIYTGVIVPEAILIVLELKNATLLNATAKLKGG